MNGQKVVKEFEYAMVVFNHRQPQRIQDASHLDGRDMDDNEVGKLCFLFFACYHHGECSECCCILPEQRKN